MKTTTQSTTLLSILCSICIGLLCSFSVWAQKSDTAANNSNIRRINKTPQIKANITSYRPYTGSSNFIPYNKVLSSSIGTTGKSSGLSSDKILNVLKIYPNPVNPNFDQINLILRLDREITLTVKIMDLLGNEIVTLSNERTAAGEQTKSYSIPSRLNSGIYFMRISAGSETVVKRISVL
jgi:hypothetical protein